ISDSGTPVASSTTAQITLSSLSAGPHTLSVRTVDASGRKSAPATMTIAVGPPDTTPPLAPTGVTAGVENAPGSPPAPHVSWTAATDLPDPGGSGVTAYWVVRDWATQWLVKAPTLDYVDATAAPGRHRYEVYAVDARNNLSAPSTAAF